MAVDACAGIAFLHQCTPPIIHRDIKSLNFLVDREYRVKLADLGEARELSSDIVDGQSHLTKNRGTPVRRQCVCTCNSPLALCANLI